MKSPIDWKMECLAIIPCLNEEAQIGAVVTRTREFLPAVLVIDDGSTDQTFRSAEQAGAVALRQPERKGKGAALALGFDWGLKNGFVWGLTLDGDGQHAAEDIPNLLREAERSAADVVVGNRMGRLESMPLIRRWVNQWMSARLSSLAKTSIPDTQCGFRLLRLELVSRATVTTTQYDFESELLIEVARLGGTISSAPVQTIYAEEQSKIHPVRDTLRWFRWMHRARRKRRKEEGGLK